MHPSHLAQLRPLCPTCRLAGRGAQPLTLGHVARAEGEEVIDGVLLCPHPACQREHPVLDGIPVVVSDIAGWAAHQLEGTLRRDDLSPFAESLLGDAAGPGSGFHAERTNLGIYGWGHWGDWVAMAGRAHGGAYARLLEDALALAEATPGGLGPLSGAPATGGDRGAASSGAPDSTPGAGPDGGPGSGPAPDRPRLGGTWLDLGCSVGRGPWALAREGASLVVGVDLNMAMLRVAEHARRAGRARFPLRRSGIVFDRVDQPLPAADPLRTSHWCCDVGLLPFAEASFDGALLLNLVDCVPQPLALLAEAARVLRPGAAALFASPYDWSPTATAPGQWIGGHSQRSASRGDPPTELRRLLSPDCAAGIDLGFVIDRERDDVPWHVQTGERATMAYRVHLAALRRKG